MSTPDQRLEHSGRMLLLIALPIAAYFSARWVESSLDDYPLLNVLDDAVHMAFLVWTLFGLYFIWQARQVFCSLEDLDGVQLYKPVYVALGAVTLLSIGWVLNNAYYGYVSFSNDTVYDSKTKPS